MQPRSPGYLEDIRDATAFILEVTRSKTLEDYRDDRILRQAVERNFEIIGEAVRRLDQHDPHTAARLSDYRRIIAFRNVLIHGYDLVDHALVWEVITNQAPILVSEVEALLHEVPPP
ncbi:MAG: DUF86 domain-containing protein [Trueperaceae bacterium]|nr:MAG: DUF86 domain-containing protein [Trueperaceae bacterium]